MVSLKTAMTAACWHPLDVVNEPVTDDAAAWMMYCPTVLAATFVLIQRVMPPSVVTVPMVD